MQPRYDMITCFVVRRAYSGGHEFLQLRRAPNDFLGGTWQNVWGQIHPGETASQAALRELHEETGLRPTKFYQINTVNTFYLAKEDCIWHCPCFCAVVPGEVAVLLNDEHDAFRWLAHEDYLKQIMWPGERLAAAELCREILDHGPSEPYLHIHP